MAPADLSAPPARTDSRSVSLTCNDGVRVGEPARGARRCSRETVRVIVRAAGIEPE